jgi:2,4-dienoyl-CoA reductase-like NADH-dependent reductase (Old Yellow Enzyme family)
MIVTENVMISTETDARFAGIPSEVLEVLGGHSGQLAGAIASENPDVAKIVQIGGQGGADSSSSGGALVSMNGMQAMPSGEPTRALSTSEIEAIVEAHAAVAAAVTANGMDGVELAGASGRLIHQSLSPWGNGRNDEWGEPLALARALIGAVRDAMGPGSVLGFRMPADDDRARHLGGNRETELAGLAKDLVSSGQIDYLNLSFGSRLYDYPIRGLRSYRYEPGVDLPLAAKMREAIGRAVPVLGVNRITTPALAEEALRRGDCDLIAMTRAHIADPDIVTKLRRGESDRIRPCVGALDCSSMSGLPPKCFHNPDVGREAGAAIVTVAEAKHVVVVGAGPAGLKAAEIAARRGHRVSVFEAEDEPGGALRHVRATTARELYGAVTWLVSELEHAGVELRCGQRIDGAAVRDLRPDAVVLASGGRRQVTLAVPGADTIQVVSGVEALTASLPQTVLVFDAHGDMEASIVAESLIARGHVVTYATPLMAFAPRANVQMLGDLERILRLSRSTVLTRTDIERIDGDCIHLIDHFGVRSERSANTIVVVAPPHQELSLVPALDALRVPYHLIGDALTARGALAAIHDGDRVGRQV